MVLDESCSVAPGQEVSLRLAVTNTGAVVDDVRLSVLGDAAPWASVHPPSLALFPGDTGHATVRLAPPEEGGPPAGSVALGVLASSTETGATAVAEATVSVVPAVRLDVRLVPVTSYGRTRAAHTLVVRNLGNTTVPVNVEAADPDQLLELQVAPRSAQVGPGEEASFTLRLRSTAGRDAPRVPFTVMATAPGAGDTSVPGTFVRRRPRRFLVPVALLVALLVVAAILAQRSREDAKAVLTSGSGSDGSTTLAGQSVPSPGVSGGPTSSGPGPTGPIDPGSTVATTTGPGTTVRPPPPPPTPPVRATPPRPTAAPGCSSDNLIDATGSFEGGLAGWRVTAGQPRTVTYDQPGTQPHPNADYLGSSYALGGPGSTSGVVASLEQVASLAPCQAGVAAGGKGMNFGGWLGGSGNQGDTVVLVVFFRAGGRALDPTCTLNGPTAADRGGVTTMVEIGAPPCPIPTAATEVGLRILFTSDGSGGGSDGSYDNAYLFVG